MRAGASPPSRTTSIINYIILYILYLYPCRTSCPKSSTCFFFSDISIFLRRKCYTRFFFPVFKYFVTYVCMPLHMRMYNQELMSRPKGGNGGVRDQVIDINKSPKIEIPRLRKRQHSAPGSLSQLSPREAERLRDGYDSTPDPAYSCLRCSAQRQTAT